MDNVTELVEYKPPVPFPARRPTATEHCCRSVRHPWLCTRIADHGGDHMAGGTSGQMYARWPQ